MIRMQNMTRIDVIKNLKTPWIDYNTDLSIVDKNSQYWFIDFKDDEGNDYDVPTVTGYIVGDSIEHYINVRLYETKKFYLKWKQGYFKLIQINDETAQILEWRDDYDFGIA